jgi:regulatory protein
MKPRSASDQLLLTKLLRFCAYRERSSLEVREKCRLLGISAAEAETLIQLLIREGFVSDRRFASVFAGSKFRLKKWGTLKISAELKRKGIDRKSIQSALAEISPSEYRKVLAELARKKIATLKPDDWSGKKRKAIGFLRSKGFEIPLILETLKELEKH